MPFPTTLEIPPTVPHLDASGCNWAAFATQLREAMLATHRWGYLDGTTTCPIPKDAANPTSSEREAIKAWECEDYVAGYFLSMRLPDWLFLSLDDATPAKTQWDIVVQRLGQPGYRNTYTPKGAALAEPDSTPGENATHAADIEGEGCLLAEEGDTHAQIVSTEAVLSQQHTQIPDPKVHAHHDRTEPDMQSRQPGNTNARAHLEGAGPEPSKDEEEHQSLKVEEEGIARKNTSVERDMGPRIKLQDPGVSPLATHEDIGSLTSPSPSPLT